MSAENKKKDWAAISDDEDESDEEVSPREEDNKAQEETEDHSPSTKENEQVITKETQEVSQPENQKAEMISIIQNSTLPKVHINLYNLNPDTTADEIKQFYQPINIDSIIPSQRKNMFDLEFSNKEDAIKVIERGAGTIRNTQFSLRISIKTLKPNDKKFDKRDNKSGRNYGNKDQTRPYNNDRRGGNYTSNRDYYDQKDQRGYGQGGKGSYNEKRGEGRYWEKKGDQGGFRKNKEGYKSEYVKKEDEIKGEESSPGLKKLPEEWEAMWKQRASQNEIPDEEAPEKTEEKKEGKSPRKGDNYYNRKDNYQGDYSRGGDYYRDDKYGKREEYKDTEIVKKGRGQTKYGKEHTLEQDKILQVNERQDSNKSTGSGKGSYKGKDYYQDDYGYKKSGFDDRRGGYDKDQGYKRDYYGGKREGQKGEGGQRNDKGGSKFIYTEKKVSDGSQYFVEKKNVGNQDKQKDPASPELKKRSSQTSKNTANPFALLSNN